MAGVSHTAFSLVDSESGELDPLSAFQTAVGELASLTKGGGAFKGLAVDLLLMVSEHSIRANKGEQEESYIDNIVNGSESFSDASDFINNNSIKFESGSLYRMLNMQNNTIGQLLSGEITDLNDLELYNIENGDIGQPQGAILVEYPASSDDKVNVLKVYLGTNENEDE